MSRTADDPGETPGEAIRHMSMNDDDKTEYYPLRDAEDDVLAEELEERKQDLRFAVDAATRALLNDDVPLTESTAEEIEDAAVALRALSKTLTVRSEYR